MAQAQTQQLDKAIARFYFEHGGRYGYRRIHDDVLESGLPASPECVRRRMRYLGFKAIQKRKFKHTTDSNYNHPILLRLIC